MWAVRRYLITVIITVVMLLNSANLQQKLAGTISIHYALLVSFQHGTYLNFLMYSDSNSSSFYDITIV